jgi:hypothetical protein
VIQTIGGEVCSDEGILVVITSLVPVMTMEQSAAPL